MKLTVNITTAVAHIIIRICVKIMAIRQDATTKNTLRPERLPVSADIY